MWRANSFFEFDCLYVLNGDHIEQISFFFLLTPFTAMPVENDH